MIDAKDGSFVPEINTKGTGPLCVDVVYALLKAKGEFLSDRLRK